MDGTNGKVLVSYSILCCLKKRRAGSALHLKMTCNPQKLQCLYKICFENDEHIIWTRVSDKSRGSSLDMWIIPLGCV